MTAEELMGRFSMTDHPENGSFVEVNYPFDGNGRAASGSIYYYVAPNEITKFHVIDCDEYWCYGKGSTLEIWLISPAGEITVQKLGIEEGCVPLVYVPKGTNFASRHGRHETEGTFLSCITVPRFTYEGFTMYEKEEILQQYPQLSEFYKTAYLGD